jgi:hypothetical protein
MRVMRFRYRHLGAHVYVRVFTGPTVDGTVANCGNLIVDRETWTVFAGSIGESRTVGDDHSRMVLQIRHEDER